MSKTASLILKKNDHTIKFILHDKYKILCKKFSLRSIAEFFVMRKYRRIGIGTQVAVRIFDMFRGKWQVAQIEGNLPAREFWRKAIGDYTRGAYEEVFFKDDHFQGIIQFFDNSLPEDTCPTQLSD